MGYTSAEDMQLLQEIEDRGFPAEYLLFENKGEKGLFISDWEPFLMGIATMESLPCTTGLRS